MAAAALALAALLAIGDWGLRTHEMSQLMRSVERSEKSIIEANDTLAARVALWNTQSATGTPSCTTNGASGACAAGASQQRLTQPAMDAWDSMRRTTAGAEASMLHFDYRVGRVVVMPWHGAVRAAQRDYRAHVAAWHDYYGDLNGDFSAYGAPRPQISGTFEVAAVSMRRALSALDPFGLDERIERTFDR